MLDDGDVFLRSGFFSPFLMKSVADGQGYERWVMVWKEEVMMTWGYSRLRAET